MGWIHAEPYNGPPRRRFCGRLLDALRYAADQDPNAIALVGGKVAFSNGIHLGGIEAAADPRAEAWANIRRIDDVAELIFNLPRGRHLRPQTTIAVLSSSAGTAAPSCRRASTSSGPASINLNYHYGAMGLSARAPQPDAAPAGRRAGRRATPPGRLPISPMAAQRLGLVDGIEPDNPADFDRWARQVATRSPPSPQGPCRRSTPPRTGSGS